jgi:hypothetical protein
MNGRWIGQMLRGLVLAGVAVACMAQGAGQKTRNVIFVMTDGMRWQEAFGGASAALLNKESGVGDLPGVRSAYWRDTATARREALLPFLWSEIAKHGQIYGNKDAGSEAYVTNGKNFSYPGYSEILCGFPDDRVDSNDKKPNPNVSVLEWLNGKPAYAGKVAAFGAWDLFPYILNTARSGLMVNAGYDPLTVAPVTPRIELLNRLKRETGVWGGEPYDAPMFLTALEYFKLHKPRVLFVSLGETDEWAHGNKYELYLKSARRVDSYVKELWETAQSMPEYRGTTSLILAVDHGRGEAPVEWRGHGQKVPDSKYVWMAFLGPDTPALGERTKIPAVTQSQVAATLAALLGEEYTGEGGKAGKPIADVVKR